MTSNASDRRRTREYETKRASLTPELRLELDLVEERILAEREHPYSYRLGDGSMLDLSAYDEAGIAVTYFPAADGNHLFVDFIIVM